MNRALSVSLLVQLLLISGCLTLVWQADQVMDKSGVGDVEAWRRFNAFAGIAFYGAAFVWLFTLILSLAGRAFGTAKAQLTIGLPPVALVVEWLLSWVI